MQQTPTFRARVDLLTIEVTVLGGTGVPVSGLKPDEFRVKVDGKRAEVETVDYQEFGPAPGVDAGAAVPRHPEALGVDDRITASRGTGGRVIVVVIDDLSAKPGENAGLRAAAERILGSVGPSDLIGLRTTSGLGPTVQPSTVREPFLAALRERSIVGQSIVSSDPYYITTKEALDIEAGNRTVRKGVITREGDTSGVEMTAFRMAKEIRSQSARQVAAIRSVIDALRPAPMPRIMIVLTRGLAFLADSIGDELEALRRTASEARVQFFAVTDADDDPEITRQRARCLPPDCADPVRAARNEYQFLNDGMKNVAHATGGEAWSAVGQADRFLLRILTETTSVYRLGVRVPANVRADRYLKLEVGTTRRGLTTRVRPYAVQETIEEVKKPLEERLNDRLAQGGAASDVPFTLATAMRGDPRGATWQVVVSMRVPAVVRGPLTVRFAVIDPSGQVEVAGQRSFDKALPAVPYELNLLVPIRSGREARRLRVALADGDGNIGGLEQPLVPKFRQFNSLAVSELFFSWVQRDDAPRVLTFETVPDEATELWCSIELYPVLTPPAGLRVRFTVSGNGPTVTIEGEVAPGTSGSDRTATVRIPVVRLPSGEFTVEATILNGNVALGSQSSVLRR
jgi:VWFA-related protein